jgi:hypothetical protein
MVMFIVLLFLFSVCHFNVLAQLELCQSNCVSSDRLVGPTKMPDTNPHPYKIAQFPTKQSGFCKLGCQMFFSQYPTNVSCTDACDYQYRYELTTGYSDIAEEARLECRDGCQSGVLVCQTGYYCRTGAMLPCAPGKFRNPVPSVSIVDLLTASECVNCPPGRYRSRDKGINIDSCTKCPVGKYAGVTGSVLVSDCQRCPAGKFAEDEGMSACKCITGESCDFEYSALSLLTENKTNFYANQIDFDRETVPYVGRS